MIYLDNAATTKPSNKAISAAQAAFDAFGNPSSLHRLGMDAEKIITEARETVARELFAEPKNIYFTSGGTESNNTAIIGYSLANKKRGNHLITTKIEHPSVLEPFKYLEQLGLRKGLKVLHGSNGGVILGVTQICSRDDKIQIRPPCPILVNPVKACVTVSLSTTAICSKKAEYLSGISDE